MSTATQYLLNVLLDFSVLLFVFSGVTKLYDRLLFKHTLLQFPFMSEPVAGAISYALPLGELVLAVFLYFNFGAAKWVAVSLLALFSAVAFLVRKRNIPCSCFGNIGGQTLSGYTVIRNAVLIGVVLSTAWLYGRVADGTSLAAVALIPVLYLIGRKALANRSSIRGLRERGIL